MKLLSSEKLRDILTAKIKSKDLTYRQAAAQTGLALRTIAKVMRPDKERYGLSIYVWNAVQQWRPRKK